MKMTVLEHLQYYCKKNADFVGGIVLLSSLLCIATALIAPQMVSNSTLFIALGGLLYFHPVTYWNALASSLIVHHVYTVLGAVPLIAIFWIFSQRLVDGSVDLLLVHMAGLALFLLSYTRKHADYTTYTYTARFSGGGLKLLTLFVASVLLVTIIRKHTTLGALLFFQGIMLCVLIKWRYNMRYNWLSTEKGLSSKQHADVWTNLEKAVKPIFLFAYLYQYHVFNPKECLNAAFETLEIKNLLSFFKNEYANDKECKNFIDLIKSHLSTRDDRAIWVWELYSNDNTLAAEKLENILFGTNPEEADALELPNLEFI